MTEQTSSVACCSITTAPSSNFHHPLDSVRADEINLASSILKKEFNGELIHFKNVWNRDAPKSELLQYLNAQHSGSPLPRLDRVVTVMFINVHKRQLYEADINIPERKIVRLEAIDKKYHAPGDATEIMQLEKLAAEDPQIQEEIKKLKLPEGTVVVCDPWIYGSDGVDDTKRLWQLYMYMRDPRHPEREESNHYAFPLDFSPIIDHDTMKVIRILRMPLGNDFTTTEEGGPKEPWQEAPANEYFRDYLGEPRKDMKPLNVVQPEGPSFRVSGNWVEWQKWRFHISCHYREGMVLTDVWYDGRSLFHRLSMSEMFVPYGDPRPPFHRKSAFDLGDIGAGITANNLRLGCDCLGSIFYFSAQTINSEGEAVEMPNVICMHEEDAGIGWKHTNYRTGVASVARNRNLVLQTIITVANYEYMFCWRLGQAAELTFEVRATGILSTSPIAQGVSVPYGTVVSPGVLAAYHQHIFCLRIDPAIDGHNNTIVSEDSVAMPLGKDNPFGVGYITKETRLDKEGYTDLDIAKNRVIKITNPNVRNPINNRPVAYKLYAHPSQMLLSHPSSYHAKRAEFADHAIWVTKYEDGERYPAAKYTNQSRGGGGIKSWVAAKENTENTDVVLYHSFGLTHNPRIEDFPVMPCEVIQVMLKPFNFFDKNPSLDVPPSEQSFNKSILVTAEQRQGGQLKL